MSVFDTIMDKFFKQLAEDGSIEDDIKRGIKPMSENKTLADQPSVEKLIREAVTNGEAKNS